MQITSFKAALKYIDNWLDFKYHNNDYTGFAIGIYYKNKLYFSKAYGFANLEAQEKLTTDHAFRIASHSKMFAATAIMQLAEAGKLNIDDKVSKHLSWFKSKKDPRLAQVTIRQLMSHSAGIIRDGATCNYWQKLEKFPNKKKLKKDLQQHALIFDNNTILKYSNYGYGLLGFVVEKVSGLPYNEFIQQNILDKVGMNNSGPDIEKETTQKIAVGYSPSYLKKPRLTFTDINTGALSPATGMYGTVENLCRFGAAFFQNESTLVNEESRKEMQRLQWKASKPIENDYGLGFILRTIDKRSIVGHSGGFPGFSTITHIDPKDKLVVSIFANSNDFPSVETATNVIKTIDFFQAKKGKTATNLKKFTGRFYSTWGIREVVLVGAELVLAFPGMPFPFGSKTKLTYQNPTTLKINEGGSYAPNGETMTYEFDAKNKIKSVTFGGMTHFPLERFEEVFF